jgi:hypothetical protein
MSILDTVTIRARLEAVKIQVAALQTEMQELGMLLVLADKFAATESQSPLTHVGSGALKAMDSVILGSGKTKRQRIIETTTEILSTGNRRSSQYLVAELESRGIEISGSDAKKKAGALSAYLSKEHGFFNSNVKLGGWTLSSLLKKARPADAPTSAGFFHNGSQATQP